MHHFILSNYKTDCFATIKDFIKKYMSCARKGDQTIYGFAKTNLNQGLFNVEFFTVTSEDRNLF